MGKSYIHIIISGMEYGIFYFQEDSLPKKSFYRSIKNCFFGMKSETSLVNFLYFPGLF